MNSGKKTMLAVTAPHVMQQLIQSPTESSVNTRQPGGDHYMKKAIQPWDYIISNDIGYLEGNVIKYVSRWKDKGGIQDLEKAKHYLEKLIEVNQE